MNTQLYLAPVRGISDMIYRNTFDECFGGIDVAMTPFLTVVKGNQLKETQLNELRPANNRLPIIPQIIGKSPENFIALSKTLHDIGIEQINWNLGCPHPTMTKKKHGSGLLPHTDLIKSFLDKVCSKAATKLSVKVRLGLNEANDLRGLIPIFNQYPIVEMTIHPRTGKQMYKGKVDLDEFENCLKISTIPVIYNGDISSKDDFNSISSRFPQIDKFMLGRGLFANPFLAREIKGKTVSQEQKISKLKLFHDMLLQRYQKRLCGDAHLILKMAGHWEYLSQILAVGHNFHKKVRKVRKLDQYLEMVESAFENLSNS